jgi:hypothetical protein
VSPELRVDRFPLTYDECRARFRRAAIESGVGVEPFPIAARGPHGQQLTIDVVRIGAVAPRRVLVVMSGVHGVEGFAGSLLQTDLLLRRRGAALPDDVGVLVVHAVNPWGMAWWRRQNESNVDLNRNWRRDDGVPFENLAYDELHHLACPDTPGLPSVDGMLALAQDLVAKRGLPWVRDGITRGQYRHADGLHFGGERTEESNRILEHLVAHSLAAADRVLTIDLHTGHGPRGEITILSDQPPGSAQDVFFRATFERVEATAENPEATTGLKVGQIANGLRAMLPDAQCYSTSLEIGTVDDLAQLRATYLEQWVHRKDSRQDPAYRSVIWDYRCCFTPDDPAWETAALHTGRDHLDRALAALVAWN